MHAGRRATRRPSSADARCQHQRLIIRSSSSSSSCLAGWRLLLVVGFQFTTLPTLLAVAFPTRLANGTMIKKLSNYPASITLDGLNAEPDFIEAACNACGAAFV